eukprot:6472791-Amphidinium_carterae.1
MERVMLEEVETDGENIGAAKWQEWHSKLEGVLHPEHSGSAGSHSSDVARMTAQRLARYICSVKDPAEKLSRYWMAGLLPETSIVRLTAGGELSLVLFACDWGAMAMRCSLSDRGE